MFHDLVVAPPGLWRDRAPDVAALAIVEADAGIVGEDPILVCGTVSPVPAARDRRADELGGDHRSVVLTVVAVVLGSVSDGLFFGKRATILPSQRTISP